MKVKKFAFFIFISASRAALYERKREFNRRRLGSRQTGSMDKSCRRNRFYRYLASIATRSRGRPVAHARFRLVEQLHSTSAIYSSYSPLPWKRIYQSPVHSYTTYSCTLITVSVYSHVIDPFLCT